MVPLWMAANAIACGNAFLLKPSERDPSAALLLADLWSQAGLPGGVFNVLHGDREVVEQLVTHREVAAISFVGSTPVAKHLYETGTSHGKRVQALGGAKNHMVVLADADVDVAADAAVSAAFGSSGERCMAISVVVCVEPVGDRLVEAITQRAENIVVGAATDAESQMGPLISEEHRAFVQSLVDGAVNDGARLAVDGRSCVVEGHEGGYFFGPTVVDGVTTTMGVYEREVFGPVLSIVRVKTFDDALRIINENPFGNGTAIFTRDGGAARTFVNAVSVGMVGVNVPIPVPVASFSFGGWKDSLFGSHHMYGPDGFSFFTRTKVTTTRWPDPATSTVDLGFPRTR
jgi:malonate-semialdehyde dehydrogenase (acetylating)/methylmalonate-semialdehyde dehydrogenase